MHWQIIWRERLGLPDLPAGGPLDGRACSSVNTCGYGLGGSAPLGVCGNKLSISYRLFLDGRNGLACLVIVELKGGGP